MNLVLVIFLNFFPGLVCCDDATDPGSCEPFVDLVEVLGCAPAADVELGWCDGSLIDQSTTCVPLNPHAGDVRCCPVSKPFLADVDVCAWPLGEATIDGHTYYGCNGAAEAVRCSTWDEFVPGSWTCSN